MATFRLCSIPNCGKPTKGRGWCAGHYHRFIRHGHPLGGGTFYGEAQKYLNEVVTPFKGNDCLTWPYARLKNGYPEIRQDGKTALVHRIVCERENGPPPSKGLEAAHSCGNGHKGCCNPAHLSWKTRGQNKADELAHGTRNRGERSGTAKLAQTDVMAIRGQGAIGDYSKLAALYGVSGTTIRDILKRRTWGWL